MCTGLLTKPHIPNNLWDRPGNPGLWQLNTEFLVERFTGTQCSQGLTGEASLGRVLHRSSGENDYTHPQKKNPHNQTVQTIKETHCGPWWRESSAAIMGEELFFRGQA